MRAFETRCRHPYVLAFTQTRNGSFPRGKTTVRFAREADQLGWEYRRVFAVTDTVKLNKHCNKSFLIDKNRIINFSTWQPKFMKLYRFSKLCLFDKIIH